MKNLFKIKTNKKDCVCPTCGSSITDDFCTVCNRYISSEIANEKLRKKYPHVKCIKCKSKKVQFDVEEEKAPIPKNFLNKIALDLIEKHNQKYPQEIPPYREFAKCRKCGCKWYVDGYKDDNKTMASLSKGFILAFVIIIFALIITVSSISENTKNHEETDTIKTQQTKITEITTQPTTQNTEITPETTTTEVTAEESTTESTTAETTTTTTIETTTEHTSTTKKGRTVYVTPYGEKYHLSADCAGKNAISRNYNDVVEIYDPCSKCAN